tara:strand:- start:192 stop:731 length:540 start_codon:yes stop_codon:yes gene_type:complete
MDHIAFYNGHDTSIVLNTTISSTALPDIITIEYSESFQKMPIYGYKSVLVDEFLKGEKLIQGQFSINSSDTTLLNNIFMEGLDDTQYTPLLANEPLISQNTINIEISYNNTDFHRSSTKTNYNEHSFEPTYKKAGAYNIKAFNFSKTIEDVTILGMQTGFSSTADPILEFYNFVAKRIT